MKNNTVICELILLKIELEELVKKVESKIQHYSILFDKEKETESN